MYPCIKTNTNQPCSREQKPPAWQHCNCQPLKN